MVAPLRAAGMWDAYACGFYYLLDPVSGEMRGEAGFQFRRRGLGPGFDNHPEAAWAVASAHQGRGLAAEAMQALRAPRSIKRTPARGGVDSAFEPSLAAPGRAAGFRGYSDVAFDGAAHLLLERAG